MPKQAKETAVEAAEEVTTKVELVEIPFGGQTFTIPKYRDDWETRAIIAFNRARSKDEQVAAIEIQFGEEQWELLLETAPKAGQFREFIDLFFKTVQAECKG